VNIAGFSVGAFDGCLKSNRGCAKQSSDLTLTRSSAAMRETLLGYFSADESFPLNLFDTEHSKSKVEHVAFEYTKGKWQRQRVRGATNQVPSTGLSPCSTSLSEAERRG